MLRYLFVFLLSIHGLIHLMGFARAFNYGNMTQLTKAITKPMGLLWLLAAFVFINAMLLFVLKNDNWPMVTIIGMVLSQILIVTVWKDAKFGTIANGIVLLVAIAAWGSIHFESTFRNDVKAKLYKDKDRQVGEVTEADISSLPDPVQKYLRYTAVLNKPKVFSMKMVFEGEMREKGKDWFPFRTLQFNFFEEPTRLFFMKAKMFGTQVPGYHDYQDATARMNIKLFGMFPVMQAHGAELDQAETVTFFNDLCLFVPARLIDKRIQWEPIDSLTAKASFTNGNNVISATLYFNETGQLINFISDDRYAIGEMKRYRFSTPVRNYKNIQGRNIPTYGEAIWHYPEGEFVYGKFQMKLIEYNVTDYKD